MPFQTAKLWRGCRHVSRYSAERTLITGYSDFTKASAFEETGQLRTWSAFMIENWRGRGLTTLLIKRHRLETTWYGP